jgi:hypothetical protein
LLANFRKYFRPTKEELETQAKWIEEHPLPKKQDINLVKTHDGLYVSEPLCNFNEQCTLCKNYWEDSYRHYIEGGICNLHKCTCGWGFTCDNFKGDVRYE